MAAVLARRPEVALVDELAHTNVPGSRNPKRRRRPVGEQQCVLPGGGLDDHGRPGQRDDEPVAGEGTAAARDLVSRSGATSARTGGPSRLGADRCW